MRAYTVATAALALDVTPKWIDNLLSHHDVPGVARGSRGIRRRLPPRSILIIAISHSLTTQAGIPLPRALEIGTALATGHEGRHRLSAVIELRVDLDALQTDLDHRLADAAEFAAVPRRGRPPRRASPSPS